MSNVTLNVKSDSVPSGFCFQNWPTSWPELVQLLSVTFPMANGGIHIGETPPAAQYQTWPWLKINSTTHKPERIYYFNQGDWVAPYPIPSSAYFLSMWKGTAESVPTIDGGDTGTITDRTGAFWEIDTAMSGYMPVGVGNIGGSGTAVTVTGTGGTETTSLTTSLIPDHTHGMGYRSPTSVEDVHLIYSGSKTLNWDGSAFAWPVNRTQGEGSQSSTSTSSSGDLITSGIVDSGTAKSHNNMPPYYGVYFIKRTARIYYKAT